MFVLLTASNVFAQNKKQERLLADGEFYIDGYGGLGTGVSFINNELTITGTLEGAFLYNQFILLGGFYEAGLNRIPKTVAYTIYAGPNQNAAFRTEGEGALNYSHSGIQAGYIYRPNFDFHLDAILQVGFGRLGLTNPVGKSLGKSTFTSITPQVRGYYRFNDWCKVHVGIGYRFIAGFEAFEEHDITNKDLRSLRITTGFSFGWFKLK